MNPCPLATISPNENIRSNKTYLIKNCMFTSAQKKGYQNLNVGFIETTYLLLFIKQQKKTILLDKNMYYYKLQSTSISGLKFLENKLEFDKDLLRHIHKASQSGYKEGLPAKI